MNELLARLEEIDRLITEHKQSIYLLEDEREQILEELKEQQQSQRLADDYAWRQMKI